MERRRYGTFEESQESANMTTANGSSFGQEDAVSQITITSTYADDHVVRKQERLFRNRLPVFCEIIVRGLARKETLSLLLPLHSVLIGLFMLSTTHKRSDWGTLARYLVSCGLFGFVGGFTNWLVICLMFTRTTAIWGVGIVAKHYEDICLKIKDSILNVILDDAFLELYTKQKFWHYIVALDIEGRLYSLLESEPLKYIINEELHLLATTPEGQILSSVGVDALTLRPLIGPFIVEIASELIPEALDNLTTNSKELCVRKVKQEVNKYLTHRLKSITSEKVTCFVETSIRTHLGWLVVVGCITGMLLGLLSQASGIGQITW